MMRNLDSHPCFNVSARHQYGRVHLPVAPACNLQCHFCNRKYDCVNESRPGVTSTILSPGQAMTYLEHIIRNDPRIRVVGIAGPGDPFANPELTMDTLRRTRKTFPETLLCVASNGLNVAPYVEELADLEVSHITITLNAVDPEIGKNIYAWVRPAKRVMRGSEAAEFLLERQIESIRLLKEKGVIVKINTIIIPGINDHHIGEVARKAESMGVDIMNCLPLYPVKGSFFENTPEPDAETVKRIRTEAAAHVSQMRHCTRCRADATGLINEGADAGINLLQHCAQLPLEPGENRPCIAVASMEGILVNQHLGEASALWVFQKEGDGFRLVGQRETPPSGSGPQRWQELAERFDDCAAIFVSGAGQTPVTALGRNGIRIIVTEGIIESLLENYCEGRTLPPPALPLPCGVGCSGNGTGCG